MFFFFFFFIIKMIYLFQLRSIVRVRTDNDNEDEILCSSGSYYRCNVYSSLIKTVITFWNCHTNWWIWSSYMCRWKQHVEVIFFSLKIKAKKKQIWIKHFFNNLILQTEFFIWTIEKSLLIVIWDFLFSFMIFSYVFQVRSNVFLK